MSAVNEKHFRDFCFSLGWQKNRIVDKDKDKFVGVKIERGEDGKLGEPRFFFPHGYPEPRSDADESTDRELKNDFFRLLRLMDEVKHDPEKLPEEEKENLDFPINAFLSVLRYYLDSGYFMETETVYKKGLFGKVSWPRTIKCVKPQVVKDAEGRYHVVYLDLISRLTHRKDDALITLVHKHCVYEAARLVGPLLGVSEAGLDKPELDFDYALFSEVVKEKISTTFNDRFLELFQALEEIIEYLRKKGSGDGEGPTELRYGVKSFACVWELIVDRIFGNISDKRDYNPHCKWKLCGESKEYENQNKEYAMRPDTIMWKDSSVFILDAKYYKYGVSYDKGDLPTSGSICKQIAYAEFVEHNASNFNECFETTEDAGNHIYNAFVLPYCHGASSNGSLPGKDAEDWAPFSARFIGICHGDWKELNQSKDSDNSKYRPYHKIACILLDMLSAMRNCAVIGDSQKEAAQAKLAEMIREAVK